MRLSCLGQLRLQDQAGNELTPRTRKARALLAVLALSGRPCSRERLADLLWSDRGAEQARSSFRQAIFELRHLDNAGAAVTSLRDTVSLNAELVTTDLWAIRAAADTGDFDSLGALLCASDAGLLTDLDGLDAELDAWLRVERAHEPSRTLAAALAAAERCLEQAGPQAAHGIVAEVQRLDPSSEEAARLAMRIAHRQGDRGSLHRHFEVLRGRLRAEFDAEPSPETHELFNTLSSSVSAGQTAQPADKSEASTAGMAILAPAPAELASVTRFSRMKRWALAIPLAAVAAGFGVVAWKPDSAPTSAAEPPLVAVLPFEQVPKGDGALAEGLWDDTRVALSQSRAVRVLGRTTSMALDGQASSPQALRKRLGVDYMLDGSVRSQGEQVRIVVSLTRARDGVSVWEQSFDGRLGDSMALQLAVAQGIEGRIRGRLAPGGGVRASQIVTSPQVYALYSEARVLIGQRGGPQIDAAAVKLREAVKLDPNYAPAWASLATTARIDRHRPQGMAKQQAEAAASARRAIALAPNLAHAYAALAFVEGENLPSSERLLKRAVELDPSNSEAWNWLGSSYAMRGLRAQAADAFERAFAIDPYYASPFLNLLQGELDHGRVSAAETLIARLKRTGPDRNFVETARANLLMSKGDYSRSAALLLPRLNASGRWEGLRRGQLGATLLRLGYFDETARLWKQPGWMAPLTRGERLPPPIIDGKAVGPRDFWLTHKFGTFASRAMLSQGRPDLVVRQYRDGFRSRADFIATLSAADTLVPAGPNLTAALRRVGDNAEADAILAEIEQDLRGRMSNDPGDRYVYWEMARIRAQQGAREEAINLLIRSHRLGWLPDGQLSPLDLARDPALESLRGDPRFKAIRARILAHIARERKELGPVRL